MQKRCNRVKEREKEEEEERNSLPGVRWGEHTNGGNACGDWLIVRAFVRSYERDRRRRQSESQSMMAHGQRDKGETSLIAIDLRTGRAHAADAR
jgi:hypothetical protein